MYVCAIFLPVCSVNIYENVMIQMINTAQVSERERGESMSGGFWSVRKMKNGDEEELENFVREYYPAILRYCYRHVFDADEAEDMTQETFERFFSSLDRYRHYGKALNYLYVIAGNLCKNALRSRREVVFSQLGEDSVKKILPKAAKGFGTGIRSRKEAGVLRHDKTGSRRFEIPFGYDDKN